jgi:hypothetical protein
VAGTKSKNRKKQSAGNIVAHHHAPLNKPSDPVVSLQALSWIQRVFVALIRFYQVTISRALPSSCRFTPSCSEYTRQAIMKYGVLNGTWMGAKRIARCHPFHPGGYDPVP